MAQLAIYIIASRINEFTSYTQRSESDEFPIILYLIKFSEDVCTYLQLQKAPLVIRSMAFASKYVHLVLTPQVTVLADNDMLRV